MGSPARRCSSEMSASSSECRSAVRGSRTPSLFYRDLSASPATRPSAFKGELGTRGRYSGTALWRDNVGGTEHPPPPIFSLEDRIERSPDGIFGESPSRLIDSRHEEVRAPHENLPALTFGSRSPSSTTANGETNLGPLFNSPPFQTFSQHRSPSSPKWWSPFREGHSPSGMLGKESERGGGSPVSGVVHQSTQSGGLLTLPAMREIVRPDTSFQFSGNVPENGADGDEWVTVFGFGPDDINIVMRELEKCGTIVRHVPGPGGANWIHVQFQSKVDAQKALYKNGTQINAALIVGVKLIDPLQRQAITERSNRTVFNVLPPKTPSHGTPLSSARPYYLQPSSGGGSQAAGSSQAAGPIALPAKSIFSQAMDHLFGL